MRVGVGGGGGGEEDLENCAYLWKNPGYAPGSKQQDWLYCSEVRVGVNLVPGLERD